MDSVENNSKVNLFSIYDRIAANTLILKKCFGFRLGERINDESSIYYWAAKNKIPVFSPALTDGSLGDMMYFHSHRNPGLVVDILSDLKRLNTMAVKVSLFTLLHSGDIYILIIFTGYQLRCNNNWWWPNKTSHL